MRRRRLIWALGLITSLLWLGCAGKKPKPGLDPYLYFQKGEAAFQKKKWEVALDNFNLVILNSPGGDLADDAQYYVAECYFNRKEYLLAVSEYQQLTERYNYSPFVEEAYFKIALSYFKQSPKYPLDQISSLKALQSFQEFIESYPNSKWCPEAESKITEIRNKLARKVYESGRLYRKLEEWEPAILYLDKMLEEFYDTEWVIPAKLEKAHCHIKLRQFDQYFALVAEIKKQKNNPEIQKRLDYLQRLYERELRKIEREKKKAQQ
jgi:outer membrane protein assembly factor BamD